MSEESRSPLFEAIEARDPERIRALLAGGEPSDQFDASGRTPLICAIESIALLAHPNRRPGLLARLLGRTARPPLEANLVELLLAGGARHDLRSYRDWPPLFHAARQGNVAGVQALLAAGADLEERNLKGRTATMIASYNLNVPVLELLLERGADVAVTDNDGRTALDFLDLRVTDRSAIKRCRHVLKKFGARKGEAAPERRFGRTLRFLRRHFVLDELAQSRAPRRWVLTPIATLASVWLIGQEHVLLMLAGAILGMLVLIFSFPSILHLPYLMATRPAKNVGTTPPRHDVERAPVSDVTQVDAVSNFMRLGWTSLTQSLRARRVRLRHVRSHLGSILLAATIASTVVGLEIRDVRFTERPELLFLVVFLMLTALWFEGLLRKGRLRDWQASRDQLASEINGQLEVEVGRETGNSGGPFILYLRTFNVTGKLALGGVDLEAAMACNIGAMLPVVALGKPGEAIGAGRILSDDESWQPSVLRLVESASLIMLIPSHHEGTMWEISQIKEKNLLGKTIFAMPPDVPFDGGRYAEQWDRAAAALAPVGLALPQHYTKGLLFKLGIDGRVMAHAPLQAEQFVLELRAASSYGTDGEDADGMNAENGDAADGSGGEEGGGGGDGGDGG